LQAHHSADNCLASRLYNDGVVMLMLLHVDATTYNTTRVSILIDALCYMNI